MNQEESLCSKCVRARPKLESHLAEQGLIECKLKNVSADTIFQAYTTFVLSKRVAMPFIVEATPGTQPAWPFQFHPTEINRCDGVIPSLDKNRL